MKKSQLKPWLNEDGNVKSDVELQEAGHNWPPSVWENYLATLEVGRRREDAVLSPSEIDGFSTMQHLSLAFSMASKQSYPLLETMLNACIHDLTPRQRDVVIRHYWDGETIAEIAASIGVSKQAVSKTMKTALAKIKTSLTDGSFRRQVMAVREMLAS